MADVLRARPDIRRDDPTLAVTRHDRFYEDGFTRTTTCDEQWESWARITNLVETKDHLVLIVTETMGYAFPKRGMTPERQDELRRFVGAHRVSR